MLSFGRAKAVQCYAYLLAWLIFVSLGLYWYLNHGGSAELTALSQAGFGYIITEEKDLSSPTDESDTPPTSSRSKLKTASNTSKKDAINSRNDEEPTFNSNNAAASNEDMDSYNYDLEEHNDAEGGERKSAGPSLLWRICNPPEDLKAMDENIQVPDFKLESIVVLLRHGDRGPLSHVGHRNVSHINCSTENPEIHNLFKFSLETLPKLPGYSQFIGPFHTFPKVPPSSQCNLGQLTQLGFAQLYTLGKMLRSTYKTTLFNQVNSNNNFGSGSVKDAATSDSLPIKLITYSTRYRRTFQSLLAFLYGFVGPKYLTQSTTIRESQSISFCFNDCTCRAVDRFRKFKVEMEQKSGKAKATMMKLVDHFNSVLHQRTETESSSIVNKTGTALLDSLLVYFCHNTRLPCKEEKRKQSSWFGKLKNTSPSMTCIDSEEISKLIHYIQQESELEKKSAPYRNYYLLSSYGLIKEIVNLALKMISAASTSSSASQSHGGMPPPNAPPPQLFQQSASSLLLSSSITGGNYPFFSLNSKQFSQQFSRTRVAVFSGHDTTLQIITGALGISQIDNHPDIHLPPYGSRLIFEFYRKTNVPPNSPRKHFFRLVYNGIAITNFISFCKNSPKLNGLNNGESIYHYTSRDRLGSNRSGSKESTLLKASQFCPMENLVRFLHDHYFEAFGNATNFREACQFLR